MTATDVLRTARTLIDTYGWTGLRLRTRFEARRAAGLFRAEPSGRSSALSSVPTIWPFTIDLDALATSVDRDTALDRADRVRRGFHEAYRSEWRPLPTEAAEWTRHPASGFQYPNEPWFAIHALAAGLDPTIGDVKDVWEPARFCWVFDLIRGFAIERDERFARTFWSRLTDFMVSSPAFRGVHWVCGQETAIRALSCLWAEAVFSKQAELADRRRLENLLIASAERIEDAIEYGVSQRNNHGISEATGLIALGARFRERDARAARWLRVGRRWLEHCLVDQFADDGWYAQHSFTYLRLALDQAIVAQRVLIATQGCGVSDRGRARIAGAIELLLDVCDPLTGDVPNHGANDGAFTLGISTAGYRDFRPSIAAAAATFDVPLPADLFCSDETLAWLGVAPPRRAVGSRPAVRVGRSGWVSARCGRIRIFARAGEYSSRPSHIDPLHVDVWIDGEPVAIDAGTFRYCAAPPWNNALSVIEVHNTISIPAHPAAVRGRRFLWLSRPRARIVDWRVLAGGNVQIELHNESWTRIGITHRRMLDLSPARLDVIDEVHCVGRPVEAVLHWLIADGAAPPSLEAPTNAATTLRRASSTDVFGWVSREYARKLPALSIRVSAAAEAGQLRFVSTFNAPRRGGERQPSH